MVKNDLNRKIAIILGLLFIIAIVAGLLLDTSDNSADISINQDQGVMGTPFEFTLAMVVVVMPILMYPILRKYKLSLALGFVVGPLAVRNWGYGMVAPIVFSLGSLMFYYLLYKSKLIPRWLSGWGFIGGLIYLPGILIGVFGLTDPTILFAPLGLQEMGLAAWLIGKEFNSSAITS